MRRLRVVLTGGTGFIGSRVLQRLLDPERTGRPVEVRASRAPSRPRPPRPACPGCPRTWPARHRCAAPARARTSWSTSPHGSRAARTSARP
ncbi:hypothetical protein LT493_36275 [Streptomyces tricolor]|nr:hypothetical protein [Streptomyces tricolor]